MRIIRNVLDNHHCKKNTLAGRFEIEMLNLFQLVTSKKLFMKSDIQIQNDVIEELKWEPSLNAPEIAVAVKNGVVTLSGQVDSYMKKLAAEQAAKRVAGVKAIAEDIQVGVSPELRKSDTEIAEAVLNALKWHTAVNESKIKVKVENGNVKLEGEVDWEYERLSAKSSIEHLTGVRSVINLITIKPKIKPSDIVQLITAALQRSATIDAKKVRVDVVGNKVILTGQVRSFAEKEDAEKAAWFAPGVSVVESKLEVSEFEYEFEG